MSSSTGKQRKNRRQQRRARHTLGVYEGKNITEQFERMDIGDDSGNLTIIGPRSARDEFPPSRNPPALLDPRIMKKRELSSGDAVLLKSEEKNRICTLWASPTVPPGHLRVNANTLRFFGANQNVSLTLCPQPISDAVSVVIVHKSVDRSEASLIEAGFRGRIVAPGCSVDISMYGRTVSFFVQNVEPSEPALVSSLTNFLIKCESEPETVNSIAYSMDDVAALDDQVESVQELVNLALFHFQDLEKYSLKPPRGVLLWGPHGVGKTLLANAVAHVSGAYITSFSDDVRAVFADAKRNAPSIVVIDDVDTVAPSRENAPTEAEARLVSTLLSILDGSDNDLGRVFVIATSSRPDAIEPALRRPGRLDREIEITVPSSIDRQMILKCLLKRVDHTLSDDELALCAQKCHGFVGGDLLALIQEAEISALKRQEAIKISDIDDAFKHVKPSAMREVVLDIPHVKWHDIGGHDDVKQKLIEAVEWPLKHADAFARMNIEPPRGLLLYGPPGCSKTMMAKALATESGLNFVAVKGPELFSKWVGESERAVRKLFKRARSVAPSIIFLDEIDALASKRGSSSGSAGVNDRVLSQLLMEMDGVEKLVGVVVIGATNRPDMLDKALMRPGRFDHILYIGLPDEAARMQIFSNQLGRIPHSPDVDPAYLCKHTDTYSGAECVAVCREAAMLALHENQDAVCVLLQHFDSALKTVTARTSKEMLMFFERFRNQNSRVEL